MADPTDGTYTDGTYGDFAGTYRELASTITNSFSEFVEIYNEIAAFVEDIAELLRVKVTQEPIPWISPDQANDLYCAAMFKWIDDNKKKERSPPRAGGRKFWNIIKKGNYWVAKYYSGEWHHGK